MNPKGTYRAEDSAVKKLGRLTIGRSKLTSDDEQVKGTDVLRAMNVSAWLIFSFFLTTSLFGEDANGPVITVRKGTSQQVEVKEIGGPAGGAAAKVLKNDLQLAGGLSTG